ncbi:SDR family NAD(P)-dependent oxidoreductase [Catenulispora yoronensis]
MPVRARLAAAEPEQQLEILLDLVRRQAASVLRHDTTDAVGTDKPFRELGFDSLTAVEMRNRLVDALSVPLPTTVLFDHPSAHELAAFLLDRLTESAGGPARAVIVQAAAVADEPIAIVGMACRFPGAVSTPEEFWRLLADGSDGIGPFPGDRGWESVLEDALAAGYRPEGGFLADVSGFDAGFFGISPREALAMDPQQRLVLEASWEAFESAGIEPGSLRGSRTGVFLGAGSSEYVALLAANPSGAEGYLMTGNVASVLSGRVSYTLGLTGPAVSVDTACSSSLVALHLAAQALRNGECEMAVAGGVTVMATPGLFGEFARQGGLAADARCKAYAGTADGTAWSEGVGVLAVERLSDARRLGHRVLGLLRGSAVNQDGASNGLTAPNGPAQENVILQALANAGVTAAEVDLLEGHGTGTRLGDPIEAQALLATYGRDRAAGPVWLGSVKSNIGHTQAAAGVAGVIKALLAMRHEAMPATLHVDEPSPLVDWESGAVALLTDAREWRREESRPRLAAVSSFGISGTNAHVIVEEGDPEPVVEVAPVPVGGVVWALSAKSEGALRAQAARLAEWAADDDEGLVETGLALAGRSRFGVRAAVVGQSRESLVAQLLEVAGGGGRSNSQNLVAGSVAVLFSGQGSQRIGMGLGLRNVLPVFTEVFDRACELLGLSIEMLSDAEVLNRTEVTQPALFAVQVAAYRQLEAWGLSASWLGGHSIGELSAAYLAGVWDLEGACKIVAARGRLMGQARAGGAMAALEATEAEVLASLPDGVGIAAVNGPTSVVVSGDADVVEALVEQYKDSGHRVRRLTVSHAFHSHHMDSALVEFEKIVASVPATLPRLKLVSTLTGTELADDVTDPTYWVRQLREAVRFADAVRFLADQGVGVFVDVSPDGVLTSMVTGVVSEAVTVPTLRKGVDEPTALTKSAAALHAAGLDLDWPTVLGGGDQPGRVGLPTYAFDRTRYWVALPPRRGSGAAGDDVDSEFWDLVGRADVDGVAAELGAVDDGERDALAGVVPMLARWRGRGRLGRSRYEVTWEKLPGATSAELTGSWLLVTSAEVPDDLRSVLSERLPQLATTDLASCEAWSAERWAAFDGVLSLLGRVGGGDAPGVSSGLAETLRLIRTCAALPKPPRIWALTRGGAAAPGGADIDPWAWQLWGLGRVAALDLPAGWGGLVDLPAQVDAETVGRLVEVLADGTQDQVALRSDGAWAARLVRLPETQTSESWKARGTVLITGASGAIGGRVARWAAERGAARIVLASRRGAEAPGYAELVAALDAAGTEAVPVVCDVADRDQVRALLAECGPDLSAVFHAAGAPA